MIVGYGFWIFLLSDIVMFSAFFAAHAVLQTATAGGPSGHDLFDPGSVALETACLLASSFTCGMSAVATGARSQLWTQVFLALTGLLGLGFVGLELQEFVELAASGATPQRSAFLSSFFTLVGTHGLHVTFGVIWLVTMMVQVSRWGLNETSIRRLTCLSMFWHFLDVIWIGVFTFVYLLSTLR